MPKDKLVCMTEGCSNSARARGLCMKCYMAAHFRVKSGETSWSQLEALGMCKTAYASPRGPFATQFQRLTETAPDA
jgi:hypothetical protein